MRKRKGGDAILKPDSEAVLKPGSNSQLETIFREHWNHARHCENERLWFTNIYVAVIAAILVFTRETCHYEQADSGLTLVLVLFGLILSVLGFQVMIALSLGYDHHISDIVMVFYYWNKMEFYRHPEKPFHFMRAFRHIYEITIALFAALSFYYGYQAWDIFSVFHDRLILPFLVFWLVLLHTYILYRWKWEGYFKNIRRFKKALQDDTEGQYKKWFKDPDFRAKVIRDAETQKRK